jgi:hypothetical protein
MEQDTLPVDVKLEIRESEDIATVFIGYEDADGQRVVVASAEPPASAELKGRKLQPDTES